MGNVFKPQKQRQKETIKILIIMMEDYLESGDRYKSVNVGYNGPKTIQIFYECGLFAGLMEMINVT